MQLIKVCIVIASETKPSLTWRSVAKQSPYLMGLLRRYNKFYLVTLLAMTKW